MSYCPQLSSVSVIGAGVAGAACAAGLQRAGLRVTLFDKSHGVGGRMATRRERWTAADGTETLAEFDHGAQHFSARRPRFRAMLARAEAAGAVAHWHPRVHAAWPAAVDRRCFVALPDMAALARHLLAGVPLDLGHAVQRLQREADGWHLTGADIDSAEPYDHVMLALPAPQAAVLLAGHHDAWADTLMAVPMAACWTLMAVTDEVEWPWDAAEPATGALAWVARNDRKPGRSAPPGLAAWVAHATPAWSAGRLEDDPAEVCAALQAALAAMLPGGRTPRWHHAAVHRWRHAAPVGTPGDGRDCWWDGRAGLGVCGDVFGGGDIESAWRSGDELADTVVAWLEQSAEPAIAA